MSQEPQTDAPPPPASERGRLPTLTAAIGETSSFIALAAKEWLPSLVDQPTNPPFQHNAAFNDEFQRVARLLVFVIVLSGMVVGSLSLLLENVATLSVVRLAIRALIIGFVIAICYQPFAFIFGVKVARRRNSPPKVVSLRQILFSVLYTFVPWIPIFTFLWVTIPAMKGSTLIFLLLVFWVCNAYVIYNFSKAVRMITRCSGARVWLSILVPAALALCFILFR